MKASVNKVLHSFIWLRQPRYWLLVIVLVAWAAALGVWAYQRPITYQLNVGGNDAPFIGNANPRRATRAEENRSMRWVRGGGSIYLPAISPSYPITLSLYTGGGGRRDVSSGLPGTRTLQVNDYPLPPIRLTENNQWYRWRLDPAVFSSGRLNLSFSIPNQITGVVFWPEGVIVEWLKVEPAVPPETIANLADLDWREVFYLVVIVLLAYSFFPLAGRRTQIFGILFCILLAVGLAMLIQGNRPSYAFYASTIALALLLSPGKGLVWVAPPVLLALWGVFRCWREHRWEMALIAILFVPALLFYATYVFWEGGVSWGPRFLLPFLPLLMLISGAALQGWRGWRRWQRGIYGGLVAIGAVVAVVGMLVNPSDAWLFGRDQVGDPWDQQVEFSLQHSLILNAFRLVGRGYIQPQSAAQLSFYHFPYFTDQLLPALLLVLLLVAAMQVVCLWYEATGLRWGETSG